MLVCYVNTVVIILNMKMFSDSICFNSISNIQLTFYSLEDNYCRDKKKKKCIIYDHASSKLSWITKSGLKSALIYFALLFQLVIPSHFF